MLRMVFKMLLTLLAFHAGSVLACSKHGTQGGIELQYGDPDDLGRIRILIGIRSTLVEPVATTTCVAGIGLGSDARPLGPDVSVLAVRLEIVNLDTGAVSVLEQFSFQADPETSDGMARGSTGSGAGDPRPLIDGAIWFGFASSVSPFSLELAVNERVQIMFEVELPASMLPMMTDVQFAAGEGQADGTPIFAGDHPVNYFTGTGPGVILSLFTINAGLNDAWVTANAQFQGFFFTVYEQLGIFFLSWFTFDSDPPGSTITATFGAPDQRWVTAGGRFRGNFVTLTVELTSGGEFNTSIPLATQQGNYGAITIFFKDCAEAVLSYQFPSLGLSGEMIVNRVLDDNIIVCEVLAAS